MNKIDLDALMESKRDIKDKRKFNREMAPEILKVNGVDHIILRRDGSQIRVDGRAFLWPGSGRWRDYITGEEGRGIFQLLKHLKRTRRKGTTLSGEHSDSP